MSDGPRRFAKPAAALGVLATMASIWWFALRPRRKIKADKAREDQ
jgi:cbb3-type cytochrome oxidase subunit 3